MHRVGRTGRMGREGVAYTFVTPEEGNELTRIEMRINRLLIRDEMPGMAVLRKPEATGEVTVDADTGEESLVKAAPKPVFGRPHAAAPPGAVTGMIRQDWRVGEPYDRCRETQRRGTHPVPDPGGDGQDRGALRIRDVLAQPEENRRAFRGGHPHHK